MKWRAEGPLAESPAVLVLALLLATTSLAGAALHGLGEPGLARAVLACGALALLALTVSMNGLLRLQGLGGDGLSAGAGVLGAALVLLTRAAAALLGGLPVEDRLFDRLDLAGFVLTSLWLARSGWSLRLLLAPPAVTGTASLAAAAVATLLAAAAYVGSAGAAEAPLARALPLLPLALWGLVVAALGAFGRVPAPEPSE